MSLLDRLRAGLARTAQQIRERLADADFIEQPASSPASTASTGARPGLALDTLEAVEDALIAADVGLPATKRIVEAVRNDRLGSLSARVGREVRRILSETAAPASISSSPHVILV